MKLLRRLFQKKPVAPLNYAALYEDLAARTPRDRAVGYGPYDVVGQVEVDLLRMEGLRPRHTLVDFGCGSGRMALHAIPYLAGGWYIGIDISDTLLRRAREEMNRAYPEPACAVSWVRQLSSRFDQKDQSVDMICAFSVFTHTEHEDTYRYLVDALRIIRPGGRFVFSCLPLDLDYARQIFVEEASMDLALRWSRVRNVVTSVDLMSAIARLAGWKVLRWYSGQVSNIEDRTGELRALGQSTCVLEAPVRA
jgi:ubiquinone/menaquinone biosynthesis C-methylase UbiE